MAKSKKAEYIITRRGVKGHAVGDVVEIEGDIPPYLVNKARVKDGSGVEVATPDPAPPPPPAK